MDIKRLPTGSVAPEDSYYIRIVAKDGAFTLAASALSQCGGDDEALSQASLAATITEAMRKRNRWAFPGPQIAVYRFFIVDQLTWSLMDTGHRAEREPVSLEERVGANSHLNWF